MIIIIKCLFVLKYLLKKATKNLELNEFKNLKNSQLDIYKINLDIKQQNIEQQEEIYRHLD